MRVTLTLVLMLVPVLFAGCACGLDDDVESRVTIQQGVYGQTSWSRGNGGHDHGYDQLSIGVYDLTTDSGAVAQATSDELGFFQLSVPPGRYRLCDPSGCVSFTMPAGLIRCDRSGSPAAWRCDG